MSYRFIGVNPDDCTGCRMCEMVCSLSRQEECSTTESAIRILVDHEFGNHIVLLCIQCAEAHCMQACPTEALHRDEKTGVVLLDDELCNGCEACIVACPINAPSLDEGRGIMLKCDLCGGDPECVKVCNTEAIVFEEQDIDSPARRAFVEETSDRLSQIKEPV